MQLLSRKHQLIIGFLNMLALLRPAGCSLVAFRIALPDGLADQVMLTPLNAYSPGVLRLKHLCSSCIRGRECRVAQQVSIDSRQRRQIAGLRTHSRKQISWEPFLEVI